MFTGGKQHPTPRPISRPARGRDRIAYVRRTAGKEGNRSAPVVALQGTLRDDGTVLLDTRPDLPPGRVRVTGQPVDS